jgi:hypothetical protein
VGFKLEFENRAARPPIYPAGSRWPGIVSSCRYDAVPKY